MFVMNINCRFSPRQNSTRFSDEKDSSVINTNDASVASSAEATLMSALPSPAMSRRHLLRGVGAGALAVAGGSLLAACGAATTSSSTVSSGAASGTVGLQLVFIKNVQFAGSYFADQNGYWKNLGLNVNLMAGGPNLTVEPVVQSGKALVGITHTAQAVKAIINGADLQIIGTGFQKNPFVLISRAAAPIKTPQDLAGKKIGVQALDLPVFTAFLTANKIDKSTFTIVPLQSDPTPLVTGELDGIMGFYSNEPNFLRIKGVEPYNLLFDSFNYPLMEEAYIVKKSNLQDPAKRAQIVALMQGESKGWLDAVASVDKAADLAVNNYGKDLKLDTSQQVLAMKSEVDLVVTADTKAHGLFWMTDTLINGTVNSLKLGGVEATKDMFTLDVLNDVYKGKATV
ncbi:ABC transporter substrate-binding protein [Arthrobacter ramosus]|nr:ABC transporter substrate-binding protein [Arthrobacter ramosus]